MPLGRAAFDTQLARLRFRLSVHLLMLARRVVVGVGLPGADAVEGVEVFLVGIGQGMQVFLRGGDLGVPHPVHDGLEVGAAGEEPGGVGVAGSWTRTGKSTPEALMAGSQTRVRKVFREIGVPSRVAINRSSGPRRRVLIESASWLQRSAGRAMVRASLSLG